MGNEKTAVFEHTLIQRINRKLNANAKRLQRACSFQMEMSIGHYFIVDLRRNCIKRKQIDIEELGRELGVLADCEVPIFAIGSGASPRSRSNDGPRGNSSKST
jgi:hypothetical protein